MRPEIPRNAVYEKIDRDIEPEERRAEEEAVPTKVKRIVSRKPVTADVCDETCPLVKKQKGELAYFQEEKTLYRVADLSEDIEISQKLSPANKNVSDKSCMISRGT